MCQPVRAALYYGSAPDCVWNAYRILCDHIDDPQAGIDHERAHDVLIQSPEFPDEPSDAEHAVDRLLNRGYFYEVDGDLRITDPDTDDE